MSNQNQYPEVTPGIFLPSDIGYKAWTCDPAICASSGALVSGRIDGTRLRWPGGIITGIAIATLAASITPVAGNFVGIYDELGNLLGQSAELGALWSGGTGAFNIPLTAPINRPYSFVDVVALANATSNPSLGRVNNSATLGIAGNPNSSPRGFSANTGVTALPASLGAKTAFGAQLWFALY